MCHRMVSSVAIIWIAATSLCLSSLAQEEELPECRDGDVFCYTQTGHKLFGDGQHAEAVEWFKKAGDNPPAIDALGFSYETGQGNPKDLPKAFQLYIEAAEKGYDQAQFHAGNCYARGVGVGVNDKVAMEWFRKAADQGHPSAAYNAGLRLYDGRGVQMDKMAAVEMFKKAAEAGHTGGMYNVGVFFLSTRGPAQSDTKAAEWFLRAAQKGHAESATNIAMCYMSGRGVPKDKEEARRWLEEAASNGNKQARAMLDTNYQGEGLGSNKPDEGHKIMDNPKEL